MAINYFFVQPLDVLILRGNKSFGGAGQHGEVVMPPWPSLFAGAFRSALLADDAARLAEFIAIGTGDGIAEAERGRQMHGLLGEALYTALGTPTAPGNFRIAWLSLATRDGSDLQAAVPLPADLQAFADAAIDDTREEAAVRLSALQPAPIPAGVST